tara:strand:+ start:1079 stop:1681 length:603 start_codon:yes stop_codon:yes gene_type:complete
MEQINQMLQVILLSYLLGSLPFAYLLSLLFKKNIFYLGTRQAGATNVWREVNRPLGIIVFFLDVTKGFISIYFSKKIGINDHLIIIPALFTIMGHWNSPFAKLRGGDGLSTFIGIGSGISIGLVLPMYIVGFFVAFIIRLRFKHPTIIAGSVGIFILSITNIFFYESSSNIQYTTILFILMFVFTHSYIYKRRHPDSGNY